MKYCSYFKDLQLSSDESLMRFAFIIMDSSAFFTTHSYSCTVKTFIIMFTSAVVLCGHLLTTDPRNRPVASNAGGKVWQLKHKGSSVGVRVGISCGDVDTVDVSVHPLTDLRLLGYERWGVVINIYQIDLQRACAAGCR